MTQDQITDMQEEEYSEGYEHGYTDGLARGFLEASIVLLIVGGAAIYVINQIIQ